jgi:glycosyltransferase involved in cell wall biosynthesis
VDTLIKAIDYAINVDFRLKQHLHALFLLRTRENGNNLQERYVFRLFERMKNRDIITVKSGFLSKSKVKSFLASSDLVVFPFKYVVSDFPMGVVEAMSLGKPVICTRVDGMSELLEDGRGIIIEPHDFAALGRILVYFSKNKLELNEYGKRSQQYSIGKPTWRDSAQKLLKLASDLI